jgi:membrane protease YdiL (CAAX protease family)
VFLLSLGSVVLIYGLVAHFAPHFVEQVLARPESETELLTRFPVLGTMIDLAGTLILAPLFEEFMFRGFLLGRLARKWGLTRAMVAVSVLFGLLHVNFFGAGAFSLVLCVVYVYTGSIWPSVVLHFVNNIISSWPTAGSGGQLAATDIQSAFWFGVVAVVVSVVPLVWFIKKHWPSKGAVLPYERANKALE